MNALQKIIASLRQYSLTYLLAFGILFSGVMELVTGKLSAPQLTWPLNFLVLLAFVLALTLIVLVARDAPFTRWLGGLRLSVFLLIVVTIMSVVAGVLPQDEIRGSRAWSSQIVSSWGFVLAMLLLLANLWVAIIRRAMRFRLVDTKFMLNHLGIFLVIAGMAFGGSDLERLKVFAMKGETVAQAFDWRDMNQQHPVALPFSVRLNEFTMEEYPPTLMLVDHRTGQFLTDRKSKLEMKVASKGTLGRWQVEVLEYIPNARPRGEKENITYEVAPATEPGAPAVRVKVTETENKAESKTGWLSLSGLKHGMRAMNLGRFVLALSASQPKLFRSDVEIETLERKFPLTVEVNKPAKVGDYKIYQSSYDSESGRFSRLSVLELVRDPWLPVVYTGIFMMLLGVIWMFWEGFREGDDNDDVA